MLALMLSAWAAGCQQQSRPGFDRIEAGMSSDEVRSILGAPSSTYRRELDEQGRLLRPERWQYGDTLSSFTTGLVFSDLPDDSVWVVVFDEDGTVLQVREPVQHDPRTDPDPRHRFQDPVDPAVPSRSR